MKITAGKEYYLIWTENPCTWNEPLKKLIADKRVKKVKGRYYTSVIPNYSIDTKDCFIIDCICNLLTGDTHTIYTSFLKEIE